MPQYSVFDVTVNNHIHGNADCLLFFRKSLNIIAYSHRGGSRNFGWGRGGGVAIKSMHVLWTYSPYVHILLYASLHYTLAEIMTL